MYGASVYPHDLGHVAMKMDRMMTHPFAWLCTISWGRSGMSFTHFRALRDGAICFLTKPFDEAVLIKSLRTAVEQRRRAGETSQPED